MEVHHHPHSARQKWTHYLWEFVMLFLAVTLGFFVENKREHMVEHGREKQYINNMLRDLKQDTIELAKNIKSREKREMYAEYLLNELNVITNDTSLSKIHYRIFQLNMLQLFNYSNSTTQQLKNSGFMRLIRKTDVIEAINNYDISVSRHKVREDVERDLTIEYIKAIAVVFNPITIKDFGDSSIRVLKPIVLEDSSIKWSTAPMDGVTGRPFLTKDPDKINLVKGWIAQLHNRNLSNLGNVHGLLKQATDMIKLINKTYH